MAIDMNNPVQMYKDIARHLRHEIKIMPSLDRQYMAIECVTCDVILVDSQRPE